MLNENIKNLRKAKGLSQEELAIKLNVVRVCRFACQPWAVRNSRLTQFPPSARAEPSELPG